MKTNSFWKPRYKWELLAWLTQNGYEELNGLNKKQLYAIYHRVRFTKRKEENV